MLELFIELAYYMIFFGGFFAAAGILGLFVEWYKRNRVLIKKKARKIGLYLAKYALIPVVFFQKKYTLKFWMSLKVKED